MRREPLFPNIGKLAIKKYFIAVLNLAKSSEEFPVNLDEVWMLVYSEKSKAVRALSITNNSLRELIIRFLPKMAKTHKEEDQLTNIT